MDGSRGWGTSVTRSGEIHVSVVTGTEHVHQTQGRFNTKPADWHRFVGGLRQ